MSAIFHFDLLDVTVVNRATKCESQLQIVVTCYTVIKLMHISYTFLFGFIFIFCLLCQYHLLMNKDYHQFQRRLYSG